ncbi:MAG TPA: hypothetical protein VHI93_08195 [Candidatus Thermoplasmatota archaeon]|nr:hypothetical protein [Candidatus Thermoplasmatota archaeon]
MPLRPAAAALVLTLLAAGCAAPPPPAPAVGPAPAAGLPPPVWQVGDWWNFTGPFGAFHYVVAGESGEDWILDTDARDLAFYNARFDVSTLGAVRKADLAGSQGAQRVAFFDWPLQDGKSWTMTLDEGQGGGALQVTARRVSDDLFAMTARRPDGTAYVSYTYDNRTRFFGEVDFKDAQGESAFKVTQQRHGAQFPGDLVRWSLEDLVQRGGDLPTAETGFFSVEATATDVHAEVRLACSTGHATVAVGVAAGPNAGRGYGLPGVTCPAQVEFAGPVGAAPTAGDQWGFVVESTGAPGVAPAGTYSLLVQQRTLHTFKAGQAPG